MEKYELGKQIGHGNYGTVHLVTHVAERRPYVVKRIPVHKMKEQSEALREAQLLSRLRHPNVIAYKESFLYDTSHGGESEEEEQAAPADFEVQGRLQIS